MIMESLALYSQYVIDGVPQELTPAEVLDAVCENRSVCRQCEEKVVDEAIDPVMKPYEFDPSLMEEYGRAVANAETGLVPLAFAGTYSRLCMARCLIDALWGEGHFCLADLRMAASWEWNCAPVGASAAFYDSVRCVAEYADSLDLKLASYSFRPSEEFRVSFNLPPVGRRCPSGIVPDAQSWIVYVPFDTCDFRLGGSLLARKLGLGGGVASQTGDADYFIDCFEVLRELVEDGIVIAGATVGEGGLMRTLDGMCSGSGISVDVADVMKSYEEDNPVRILFAEVPGVVIQIKDMDFDYLDAELLLQDVAFFPLGHPEPGASGVRVKTGGKSGIQTILESLIQNAEGED